MRKVTNRYSDAVRTTFRSATDVNTGAVIDESRLDELLRYVHSDGSGVRPGESLAHWAHGKLKAHPPLLPSGTRYVAYSGSDRLGASNGHAATMHVNSSDGRAGLISETPWGTFLKTASRDSEMAVAIDKLERFLDDAGIRPAHGKVPGALADTLWNYGSAPFMENAIRSGLPIIGFVDGADPGRGYARHELPTLLRSPSTVFNGYAVRDIVGDPRRFTADAAAQFKAMEWSAIQAVTLYSGRPIAAAEFRRMVDLGYGYDAAKNTLFGRPVDDVIRRPLDEVAELGHRWSQWHASRQGHGHYRSPLEAWRRMTRDGVFADDVRFYPLATTNAPTQGDAVFSRAAGRAPMSGGRVLGALGQWGLALDTVATAREVEALDAGANAMGADSALLHFGGRHLGAWGGAVLGAKTAATLGAGTGPGAWVAGMAGAVVGAASGEAVARAIDDARAFHQMDREGHHWRMDAAHPERGWTRSVSRADPDAPRLAGVGHGAPAYRTETFRATPDLANELDYRAAGVQVQLALAHPEPPRDPHTLPADALDTPSLREAPWQRNAVTGAWSRDVTVGYLEHGLPRMHREAASPERAASLDAAAQAIVAANASRTPEAIASQYMAMWRERGWDRFGPPEAAAIDADRAPVTARDSTRDAPAQTEPARPVSPFEARLDRMLDAAARGDWSAFGDDVRAMASSPVAEAFRERAVMQVNHQEQLAAQERQLAEQQQWIEVMSQQQTQQMSRGRSR